MCAQQASAPYSTHPSSQPAGERQLALSCCRKAVMSDKLRASFQLQPTALHCVILSKPLSLVIAHFCPLEHGSEDTDSAPFPREVLGRREVMGKKLGENPEERRRVNSWVYYQDGKQI